MWTAGAAAALSIAVAALVPLAGVLLLGWDWREVVLLYWLESLTLVITVHIAQRRTSGPVLAPGDAPPILGSHEHPPEGPALRRGVLWRGTGIWLVQGLVVLGVIVVATAWPPAGIAWVLVGWLLLSGAAILAASRGPAPRTSQSSLAWGWFRRTAVLQLVLLVLLFSARALEAGPWAAVLLIAAHTVIESTALLARGSRGPRRE